MEKTLLEKKPVMRRVQQMHLWLGTVFAPMILFFALTGALQTFNLHEGPPGTPPGLIAQLAAVHKNQRLLGERPEGRPPGSAHRPPEAGAGAATHGGPPHGQGPGEERQQGPSPLPLKIYVALMSAGLFATTLLGIWMAFKYSRDKRVVWGLLAAGTLLPTALLFL